MIERSDPFKVGQEVEDLSEGKLNDALSGSRDWRIATPSEEEAKLVDLPAEVSGQFQVAE